MSLRTSVHSSTGTLNGVVAGSTTGMSTVFLGQSYKKVAHLSALVVVDVETNTMTLSAKWQVSNDASTWYDVANGSQNAAAVVLGTGTGGDDASITKVIPVSSDSIYGWKFARLALVNGVADGNTADTYTVSYSYRQLTGAEAAR